MTELPKGWVEARLGEVTTKLVDGSHNPPPKAEEGMPMLSARNIIDGEIRFDDFRLIDERSFALEHSRTRVAVNDVLLTIVGTIGRSAVVSSDTPPFSLQRSVAVLTPKEGLIPHFLKYYFLSPNAQTWLEANAKGTAQKGVYLKALSSMPIPLPSFPEQKRIVAKIDSLTARTTRAHTDLARIPALVAKYKTRIMELGTSGELTRDWRATRDLSKGATVRLGSVAKSLNYGTSAKSSKEGEVPVLRMGNIQDGRLDWSDLVFTSVPEEIKKYRLESGDVLFNRTNSPELVGKSAVYKGERKAIFAGYLIRIRCGDRLVPDYLGYCLNGPQGRRFSWQVKSDGVSQSNINAKKLADFNFLLPTKEEQTEIVHRIETAFAWLDRVGTDHASASKLLPKLDVAILAKAFRGELVPQDTNDEPASVLLERVKADPSEQPRRGRGRTPRAETIEEKFMPLGKNS